MAAPPPQQQQQQQHQGGGGGGGAWQMLFLVGPAGGPPPPLPVAAFPLPAMLLQGQQHHAGAGGGEEQPALLGGPGPGAPGGQVMPVAAAGAGLPEIPIDRATFDWCFAPRELDLTLRMAWQTMRRRMTAEGVDRFTLRRGFFESGFMAVVACFLRDATLPLHVHFGCWQIVKLVLAEATNFNDPNETDLFRLAVDAGFCDLAVAEFVCDPPRVCQYERDGVMFVLPLSEPLMDFIVNLAFFAAKDLTQRHFHLTVFAKLRLMDFPENRQAIQQLLLTLANLAKAGGGFVLSPADVLRLRRWASMLRPVAGAQQQQLLLPQPQEPNLGEPGAAAQAAVLAAQEAGIEDADDPNANHKLIGVMASEVILHAADPNVARELLLNRDVPMLHLLGDVYSDIVAAGRTMGAFVALGARWSLCEVGMDLRRIFVDVLGRDSASTFTDADTLAELDVALSNMLACLAEFTPALTGEDARLMMDGLRLFAWTCERFQGEQGRVRPVVDSATPEVRSRFLALLANPPSHHPDMRRCAEAIAKELGVHVCDE